MMRFVVFFLLFVTAGVSAQTPFITLWKTDNPGGSGNNQITLPVDLNATGYDFSVQWGDGTVRAWKDGDNPGLLTKTYAQPGIYTVQITGNFPRMIFYQRPGIGHSQDKLKLLSVEQWGNIQWRSMFGAFWGAGNMVINATDAPNLSQVSSIEQMFHSATAMNSDLDHWDVSGVSVMSFAFSGAADQSSQFNGALGSWNVSNVTHMREMFADAVSFNRDISGWNVGQVVTMQGMFVNASSFNADLGSWDVSQVTNMNSMFRQAVSFNRDLSGWNVAKVTDMGRMFELASHPFFYPKIGGWNVANVTNMERMFYQSPAFNENLGHWNVGKVENMSGMLDGTGLSVENYDATVMGWAAQSPNLKDGVEVGVAGLSYCVSHAARQFLISEHGWSFVGDQRASDCPGAFVTRWKTDNPGPSADHQISIPIHPDESYDFVIDWGDGNSLSWQSGDDPALLTHSYARPGTYLVWITGSFPRIYFNFEGDRQKLLQVLSWGDIQWHSMAHAFAGAVNLNVFWAAGVPDLSQVTSTWSMFEGAASLNADLDDWDVSNVELMVSMFKDAYQFNGSIGSWDVSNVSSMTNMFRQAFAFNQHIGNWNVSSVESMQAMFRGALAFDQDLNGWDVSNVYDMREMFLNAGEFDRSLGDWNIQSVSDMSNMLRHSGLSVANYDATLTGWSSLTFTPPFVTLGADGLIYCEAVSARESLINDSLWIIHGDEYCDDVELSAPELIAPADGIDVNGTEVLLQWREIALAQGYRVQVAPLRNSFDLALIDSNTRATDFVASGLRAGEFYKWRVRAQAGSQTIGDWSEVWHFRPVDSAEDRIFDDRFQVP